MRLSACPMAMTAAMTAAIFAACGGPPRAEPDGPGGSAAHANLVTGATLATDDDEHPSYNRNELEQALITERGAEASDEQRVAQLQAGSDGDGLRTATADLAVRRRFIRSLEQCQAEHHNCPPRIDDPKWTWDPNAPTSDPAKPPLDAALRFDLEDWRKIADELRGRACACRTIACVDALGVTIDAVEKRPMQDVSGDDAASASITGARECLFRLRGKTN